MGRASCECGVAREDKHNKGEGNGRVRVGEEILRLDDKRVAGVRKERCDKKRKLARETGGRRMGGE